MAVHAKWRSQDCPACGTYLLSTTMGITEIGSPLVVCPKCGKTSYTKMRREWYNYQEKDLLCLIPLLMAAGIACIIWHGDPLVKLLGGVFLAFSGISGAGELSSIIESKRRMRDPEYLAELLRWKIIRQEEYEDFLRNAQRSNK